jgi:hypothetical protein
MIADALLFEIGPPPEHGWNDGSRAKFEECSRYLAERGLEHTSDMLREFRNTAHAFTEGSRDPSVSFSVHRIARSPEMLAEAIRRNEGKPPTARFVERVRREVREKAERDETLRREREHRRAAEKAERERQRALAAENERVQRRAEERAREAEAEAERIRREQQAVAEAKAERERREAERKAAQIAAELEDKRVAEALASSKSLGSRRISNAVHEREADRRRKVRERNEQAAADGGLPLPAYVPAMIEKIGEWASSMSVLTDDLAELPSDHPLVETLRCTVAELRDQADRWVDALSDSRPKFEVIEGRVA